MKTNEIAGVGNHNTAPYWEYDTRLGRRWNLDPVVKEWESPYEGLSDNPILKNDVLGNDPNSYVVDGKSGSATKVDDKGGDKTDYVTVKTPETKNALGITLPASEYSYSTSVQNISVQGTENSYRVPGIKATGLPYTGLAEPTDDPISSFGPGIAKWAGEKMLAYAAEKMAAKAAVEASYVNLASASRTAHILAGDATGGGHSWLSSLKSFKNGLSGTKSMFPISWSESKIMNAVSEVATSNPWIQQTGKAGVLFTRSGAPVRFITEGIYDGVKMRVVVTHSEIITAFPIK